MIKCDFCYSDLEATRARRIKAPLMVTLLPENEAGVLGLISPDDWAACDVCYFRLCAKKFDLMARELLFDVLGNDLVPAIASGEYLVLWRMLVSQYSAMSPAC